MTAADAAGHLHIWLIHMGENVHSDGHDVRLYRLGILADHLVQRGHHVTRWAPTFSHNRLEQRYIRDTDVTISSNHVIRHIFAEGYSHPRSIARWRFHREVARRWWELGTASPRPDVIVTSLPTPEIAEVGIALGAKFRCPVVLDVRDLWPDVYAALVPRRLRPAVSLLMAPMRHRVGRVARSSDAIVAVSQTYLDWTMDRAGTPVRSLDRVVPLSYQPPQVDESRLGAALTKWKSRVAGARLNCVFLGTFTRFFSFGDVIEAARSLEQRRPGEVNWILAGDGPVHEAVRAEAAGLSNVHLPGWVDGAEGMALLRLASVGLTPYAAGAPQSLPNKPFEYTSAGLAVINSLVGELATLINRHGFGVNYPSGCAADLVAAVEWYLDHPDYLERHSNAAAHFYGSHMAPGVVYGAFADHVEAVARATAASASLVSAQWTDRPRGYLGKRAIDAAVASVGLLVLAPVFAAIAVIVRATSPGPVFYRGRRVGWAGRDFDILKFRTMRHQPTTQLTTAKNDPRVTPIGRILRRLKLDELPQLLNVLRGEMSLVGPRPEFRQWVERYSDRELEILTARPGITDLASIMFFDLAEHVGEGGDADKRYLESTFDRKNALRLQYVRSMSLSRDVRIVGRTVRRAFR